MRNYENYKIFYDDFSGNKLLLCCFFLLIRFQIVFEILCIIGVTAEQFRKWGDTLGGIAEIAIEVEIFLIVIFVILKLAKKNNVETKVDVDR
jgi:hypothetical protein